MASQKRKAAKKSTPKARRQKTTAKSVAMEKVPQPHGGALNRGGTPGNKGGTGRPPDAFKQMCRDLASSKEVEKELVKILKKGSGDPMFLGALKWASEHGYGRPAQSVTHEVGITLEQMIVESFGPKA